MRPVAVEFKPDLRPGAWHVGAALASLVLGLALLGLGSHRHGIASSAERVAAGGLTTDPLPLKHSATAGPAYERSAREFLQVRSHPWAEALTALERTPFERGVLNSIEVDSSSIQTGVSIQMKVHSEQSLIEGLRALNVGQPRDGSGLVWSVQRVTYLPRDQSFEAELTAGSQALR